MTDDEPYQDAEFSGEHYNYLRDFYTSDYLPLLVNDIKASHLSPRAKRAFISTVVGACSTTTFLSKQQNVQDSEIGLELILNTIIPACNKTDVNLPEYPRLLEQLKEHMRYIATRTIGSDRERILNNRQTVEHIQTMNEKEQEKKRKSGLGILGMFTGKTGDD